MKERKGVIFYETPCMYICVFLLALSKCWYFQQW